MTTTLGFAAAGATIGKLGAAKVPAHDTSIQAGNEFTAGSGAESRISQDLRSAVSRTFFAVSCSLILPSVPSQLPRQWARFGISAVVGGRNLPYELAALAVLAVKRPVIRGENDHGTMKRAGLSQLVHCPLDQIMPGESRGELGTVARRRPTPRPL
jgi:hypothetical protein